MFSAESAVKKIKEQTMYEYNSQKLYILTHVGAWPDTEQVCARTG